MFALTLRGTLATACLLFVAALAPAQDFKVDTKITTIGRAKPTAKEPAAQQAKTTTTFHAGKVFDYLYAGDQTTIYEPAQERFVILDGARRMATEYRFEVISGEIERVVRRSESKIRDDRLNPSRRELQKKADFLEFLVHPKFEEKDDSLGGTRRRLTLLSTYAIYTVDYETTAGDQPVEAYLNYLDWAARLNFIVDPQPERLPAVRLELNTALRRRKVLPSAVTLRWISPDGSTSKDLLRRADHTFTWELNEFDRKTIAYREKMLRSPGIEWKSFDPSKATSATALR